MGRIDSRRLIEDLRAQVQAGNHEVLLSKALDNPEIVTDLLRRAVDPHQRLVLAGIAGEIKLKSATPVLLSILAGDQDEKMLRGAITALGMIGDPAATTPVSEFLYSGSVELIIAAIQALGQLGTSAAIQRLAQKLGSDPELDRMILDAFAYSREPEAIEQLNAILSAPRAYLRNAGKQRLIEIGAKAVPTLLGNLYVDDSDLLIHTMNVLGAIGDDSAVSPIRRLLHNEPEDPNVRFAAYEALGQLPITRGALALAQGLTDPVASVRSAAAGAINHNYNTVLAAGIKNMVRDEDSTAKPISRTIIDAQCDHMFLDFVGQPAFQAFAVDYLGRQAHADIRRHFVELLTTHDMAPLAMAIQGQSLIAGRPALKVFAVDDSKMILNIYRTVLHSLGCEPLLFEFPALAIEAAKSAKPDLIFTDLNMPDISGVALTRAIRQWYSKTALPIVMVTTQHESRDDEAAYKAGINAIVNKPFNEVILQEAIDSQLQKKAA